MEELGREDKTRILIVDDNVEEPYDLAVLSPPSMEAIRCGSVAAARALVEELKPKAVFIDADLRGSKDFIKWIKRHKSSAVVTMSKNPVCSDHARWGADGHIEKPLNRSSLEMAMRRICDGASGIEEAPGSISSGYDKPGRPESVNDYENVHVVTQEVIAVWGAKGGAGRTTIAANLAAHLSDLKVLLIDFNFSEGPSDLSAMLRLPAVPHIGRLIDNLGDRRQGFVDSLIEPPTEAFTVVQPPPTLEIAERIGVDEVVDVIDNARRMFNIVILDLPANQSPVTMEAVDMATTILFVTQMHNGSIARIEAIKDQLKSDVTKMLVINRFSGNPVKAREISYFLDLPIAAVVQEDAHLADNIKNDTIFIDSNTIFSEGIVEIGKSLLGFKSKDLKSKWNIFNLLKSI
jgi:MinD-like ATPase involved in chromosome partitioning or flagellar assembly